MSDKKDLSRREFLGASLAGGAALLAGRALFPSVQVPRKTGSDRPNILLIITDQQGLDTFSSLGCRHVHTTSLDRLKARAVSFAESYSANPLCSPARSSLFTGRTSSETGVIYNGLSIRSGIPNLGQWLSQRGYETVYVGKWHLPNGYQAEIEGFTVYPAGLGLRGTLGDRSVSRAAEAFLRSRTSSQPFLLVVSLLQPHDICGWIRRHHKPLSRLPVTGIESDLPPLPKNLQARPPEPRSAKIERMPGWNDLSWRYYLWSYYRMVEEADREVGRVLDALEETGHARDTLVIFTSDHGEGRGRHGTVLKNFLYEEAVKVPLVVAFPGRIQENVVVHERLVSGLDLVPTVCDFAGVPLPPRQRGRSLRPLLEGRQVTWREFLVSEVRNDTGRMVRAGRFKLIVYRNDPTVQLFDLAEDPWETRNLAGEPRYASELAELKRLLNQWEADLDLAPNAKGRFVLE